MQNLTQVRRNMCRLKHLSQAINFLRKFYSNEIWKMPVIFLVLHALYIFYFFFSAGERDILWCAGLFLRVNYNAADIYPESFFLLSF